jgi:hypothetical protein
MDEAKEEIQAVVEDITITITIQINKIKIANNKKVSQN